MCGASFPSAVANVPPASPRSLLLVPHPVQDIFGLRGDSDPPFVDGYGNVVNAASRLSRVTIF